MAMPPKWACVWIAGRATTGAYPAPFRMLWMRTWWFVGGTLNPGWTENLAMISLAGAIGQIIRVPMSINARVDTFRAYWTIASGAQHLYTNVGGYQGFALHDQAPRALAPLIRITTDDVTGEVKGRLFPFFMSSSDLDGNNIKPAAQFGYTLLYSGFLTGHSFQGLTFNPAVRSVKHDTLFGATSYTCADKLAYIRRRQTHWLKGNTGLPTNFGP